MNKAHFIPVLLLSLLTACSDQNTAVEDTALKNATVDDTPIQSLEVGGTVSLSRQPGADFGAPDNKAWREAQEYTMDLNLAP
ncbi:MAG: hypothetical protein ACE1Y4_03890, partial [Lysobacterales bacterium]